MPKVDRATLSKIAPDPQTVKAFEDLFSDSSDNAAAITKVTNIANGAQATANAANLAATNAQSRADSAYSLANSAKQSAVNAQTTADAAKNLASDAADQIDIIESPDGAHVVGIELSGNVSGNNVRDAIYSLDANDGSGFRNVVLNGTFTVNQRRYASGTPTTVANQYTLDRWRVVVAGQSVSFVSTNNGNLATAPAGGIEQVIEGSLIVQQAYVLSWLGNATCTVDGAAKANGAKLALTPGNNITLRFIGGSVTSVQLEVGKSPHPLEPRPYNVELRLCQRYAFLWTSLGTMGVCGTASGTYAVLFPERMRAIPTYESTSVSDFNDGVAAIAITASPVINQADSGGATMRFTASGTTPGRAAILNDGSAGIFSAEF